MLRERLIVVIVMLPVLVAVMVLGGYVYAAVIALALGLAAWEFWRMFTKGGHSPSAVVMIGGTVILSVRSLLTFVDFEFLLSILVLIAMTVHLIEYERGKNSAAIGFCITLAGMLYWGFIGGYLIQLRELPQGLWWLLVVLPTAWATDLGGYIAGHLFGKHRFTERLSPKKTWEGYVGGVLLGVLAAGLFALLWHPRAEEITLVKGLILGAAISLLIPLGDLGASMFKRVFNFKDSSNLIPGHGGIIDRIDTWVWAAFIGYHLIQFLIPISQ